MAALAFSLLLLSSVVAPAFAAQMQDTESFERRDAGAPRSNVLDSSDAHPATIPGARVETVPGSQTDDVSGEGRSGDADRANASISKNATKTQVTLVTGQTVTVVETGNRTRYRVSGDERMRKVTTGNTTYVFPVGVDFSKFDRHLFDVEFLVSQNLTDAETDAIPIIVSETDQQRFVAGSDSQPSGTSAGGTLDAVAGTERRATLESIGAEAGTVAKERTGRAYADLVADDSVDRVTLDVKYRADLSDTEDAVSASNARQTYGASGNDVKVAILDSGIDESHPAIDDVVASKDFTDDTPRKTPDPRGHGTHVAGIVASDDAEYTGMAPNASLMDVRVLGSGGWGYTSWIVDGMEYADRQGADVISMSIGGSVYYERSNDRYTEAVNAAVENGTLVVTSAGNDGYYGYGTVSTPGIQSKALTVGASNATSGEIAPFSSRGPTPHGYYLKPNLVAPGVGVTSTASSDAGYASGSFTSYSGTSMSAPTVSGVAALLLEEHPGWSPERVKSVLTSTSDPLGSYDAYTQGAGEVNATDALGTNVVVSPGTLDFGTFGNNTTASRNVTIRNLGDSEVTLSADPSAKAIKSDATAHVTVNKSSVTVPANGVAHLNLTVYTNTTHGVYSGRLSLGENYSAIFGFARAHEVTVEKSGIGGTSTDGDTVWFFADDTRPLATAEFEGLDQVNGSPTASTTYHVMDGGKYHLLSDGIDEGTGQPIVLSETVTVDGDEAVTLDESDTVEYSLDTSDVEAANGHGSLSTRSVEVNYFEQTGDGTEYLASITSASADGTTVRFSEDTNFEATVERLLVPDGTTRSSDNFSAANLYHLIHEVDGVSGNRRTEVAPSDLAGKNVTYYRTTKDGTYDVRMSAKADAWFDSPFEHVVTDGIGDRREQTVYLNDNVSVHGVGATAEASASESWNLSTTYTGYLGMHIDEELNEHPFVGNVHWNVDYSTGELFYYATPQVGQGFHAFEDGTADSLRLSRNGTQVLSETFSDGVTTNYTGLSVEPNTDLELTMVGNNAATSLSTRTVTTYDGTYEPGEDYHPPSISTVDVTTLSTNNTGGERIHVVFTTDSDAADASVQFATSASKVPFGNDTGNWKTASVEKAFSSDYSTVYEATFNVSERFGEHVGTMDVALRTADERGNSVEMTTFDGFRVDARDPTIQVTDAGASETPADPPTGPIYTNDTLTVNATVNGTPGDARLAGVTLSADFANFRTGERATTDDGRNWTVTQRLGDLSDDGNYTAEIVGVDRHGNVNRTEVATVVLDRGAPELGATIDRVDDTTGRINVSANESLAADPSVTLELPDGTTADVDVNESGDIWTDTFALGGSGTYNATVTGTDLAGNVGHANSTTDVESVTTENKTVTVILEKSGLFIEFRTEKDVASTVTVTGSRNALAPLTRNFEGVNFLNGELGDKLTDNLTDATIGIPVENLPKGIRKKEVKIRYYNESTQEWERRATSVQTRNVTGEAKTYWVTNVTHFSTYGAVVDDQTAPTLDRKSPDGVTYDASTSWTTVEFNYSDDISGVNASAVEAYFDGNRITDDPATNVTGEYVRYNATGLAEGDHEATVTVVDEAENEKNYTASFSVRAADVGDTSSGGSGGGGDGGGGGGGGGDLPPPSVLVEVSELGPSHVEASITNARNGNPGKASLPDGFGAGEATFESLRVRPNSATALSEFALDARTSADAPSGVSSLDAASATFGYLTVTAAELSDGDIDSMRVGFAVPKSATDAPANVALYRYADDEWTRLETELADDSGDSYRFGASADGTGTYAVGVSEPSFAVRDASLGASSISVGDTAAVTAVVENVGSGAGTYTVELTADGEVVATKDVTLSAGERTSITFDHRFDASGEREIAVESASAGVLEVTDDSARRTTDGTAGEGEGDGNGGNGGIPGFGVPATLAALVGAVLVVRRRWS